MTPTRRLPFLAALGGTPGYIAVVALLAFVVGGWALWAYGLSVGPEFLVFLLLAALVRVVPEVVVGDRVSLAISSIVMIAAQALLGPAGAVVVGALVGSFQGSTRLGRLFNASQFSIYGCAGGVAFLAAGGTVDPDQLRGTTEILRQLALPLLVCDVVQVLINLSLLTGIVRVSSGAAMRPQILSLLRGAGLASIGFGMIAFPMVLLWRPAGLGPVSVVIVLAPLLVAQWVYRQRADELEGQQRALEVLVAALEAKAPHLTGHSTRVAELSARMAEHLGLSPQQVSDTRMAGMLHDVGQTSLPTREVRQLDLVDTSTTSAYPATGAAILGDLTFLRGALDPIRHHRTAVDAGSGAPLTSRIVALADHYDLLTHVGGPAGVAMAPAGVRDALAARVDAELLRALDAALSRVRAEESSR